MCNDMSHSYEARDVQICAKIQLQMFHDSFRCSPALVNQNIRIGKMFESKSVISRAESPGQFAAQLDIVHFCVFDLNKNCNVKTKQVSVGVKHSGCRVHEYTYIRVHV